MLGKEVIYLLLIIGTYVSCVCYIPFYWQKMGTDKFQKLSTAISLQRLIFSS